MCQHLRVRRGRLHITGASGSGATTLGRAVADAWAVPHADADDYFWVPTDPPYTTKREIPDRLRLMGDLFLGREAWVLSGSMLGWGDPAVAQCHAVVFLALDPDVRLARLAARQRTRHEGRVEDEAATTEFLTWARGYDDPAFDGRSRAHHEDWLAALDVPVLRLDSGRPPAELRDAVLEWDPGP